MSVRKALFGVLILLSALPSLRTQEKPQILRPRPLEEIILAVPDIQPATSEHGAELVEPLRTFNQVLWDDLKFSGSFTLAGKSFYPPKPIVRPEDVNYDAWSTLPFKVSFLTAGTLDLVGGVVRAEFRVFDMKQHTMSFGERISGDTDQIRSIAHRWADEIVYRLTAGGSKGIASTKIAYVSRKGNAKEINTMDYDGYDQRSFTHNSSLNNFPTWAPDNSKLAFLSYRTGKPQIDIYSYLDGSRLPFPIFPTFVSTPVIAPDGTHLVFTMTVAGRKDSDLFVSNLDGTERRNITNNPAIDTSPTWSPSGKQIAFVSDREGQSQVFICDVDGANVRRIVKEGGDADSPAWSPDGKWIAFHWKPRFGTAYDIFLVEVSSGMIHQLTSNAGSNEGPSWAPDSRHLTFQSNRNGSPQIFIQLLDGPELRMVTTQGTNTSPAWGGYRKD